MFYPNTDSNTNPVLLLRRGDGKGLLGTSIECISYIQQTNSAFVLVTSVIETYSKPVGTP